MNDQLSKDERIRLEALNQAVAAGVGGAREGILNMAYKFEDYIRNGAEDGK
jgi:hypothetical protein